ncbi:MAG: phytase [Fimbriimonadaceae bacterium]|nr:phytase [Fimbriimonadaceae bacterium]QYK55994.1 MAG: phytase [Fimbriimonadaceae bacterium]
MGPLLPLLALWALLPTQEPARTLELTPAFATEPVGHDADDPAIWVNRRDPSKSLIIGTDKNAEDGGLFVFDLEGRVVQSFVGMKRPNNVDVQYGFVMGEDTVDLAVATERGAKKLRVLAIDPDTGKMQDVTGETRVFIGRTGESGAPMGISLAKRPNGEIWAVVGSKTGPTEGYLEMLRVTAIGSRVATEPLGNFGAFSGEGEIEAIAVDSEMNEVCYADEGFGLRRYRFDEQGSATKVEEFATAGYSGDREGLAYATIKGRRFLFSSDQIENGSKVFVWEEVEGRFKLKLTLLTGADSTDGLEVTTEALGERFPQGALVVMNSKGKNFLVFDLAPVISALAQE